MVLFKEALNIALENVKVKQEKEIINIEEALNRVLAKDIICIKNLPTYNNAALDGYAFRHKDINSKLKIVSTILAGDCQEPILQDNECYKIMTGAKVPSDADTVIQREFCKVENGFVTIEKEVKKGSTIRLKGEEHKVGEILLEKGEILTPAKIALLASQGIVEVEVYKKLNVAIISTGSELKEPWEEASEDEVYNINAINIMMHLKNLNLNISYLGSIPDDLENSINFVSNLKNYDLIISTGGISMGDADFTKRAFIENGLKEIFHGIRVKPGHPTMMGVMQDSFVMAMPGNPLAAILNILLLSKIVILKMQGAKNYYPNIIEVVNRDNLKLKPNRVNIVLGNIEGNNFVVYNNNDYGSGMITPLVKSKFVALFCEDISEVKQNQLVKVIDFNEIYDSKNSDFIN